MTFSTPQPQVPDYGQLVTFLFQPFLSAADALAIDCEYTIGRQRVWIRVAIASTDQGSAFGRGGRNIQAVRTILQAAATVAGQSIHLDIYGNVSSKYRDSDEMPDNTSSSTPVENRPPRIKPTRKSVDGEERSSGSGDDSASVPPPRPRR